MIKAIAVPDDPHLPISIVDLDVYDVLAYRRAVGGNLQLVDFVRPPASLYVNEDAARLRLPVNLRATALLWVHHPAFRDHDHIAGPALIVGPPDRHGNDQSAPAELVELLTHTSTFGIETREPGAHQWWTVLAVFGDWLEAYTEAINMARRFAPHLEVRVVPAQ